MQKTAKDPHIIGTTPYENGQYSHRLSQNTPLLAAAARSHPFKQLKVARKPTAISSTTPKTKKHIPNPQNNPKIHRPRLQHRLATADPLTKQVPSLKSLAYHQWHLIFNHIHPRTLNTMARQQLIPLRDILRQPPTHLNCSACSNGKLRPRPHKPVQHNYTIAVAMPSDLCGPITPKSQQGNSYFLTLIYTNSRYALLSFLPNQKAVIPQLETALRVITNIHGHPASILTTDNAKEYISKTANKLYNDFNITIRTTIPYTPQENGIAERLNTTLVAAARRTIYHANLPNSY